MNSNVLSTLLVNVTQLVTKLEEWNTTNTLIEIECVLDMSEPNLPTEEGIKTHCGASACHGGWLHLILSKEEGPFTPPAYTTYDEDSEVKRRFKALYQNKESYDYSLGCSALSMYLGFSTYGEFLRFFNDHIFILGTEASSLFAHSPFWRNHKTFCKLLESKQITSRQDLRIIAEWWKYIKTILDNLELVCDNVGDTKLVTTTLTLLELNNYDNEIHEKLYEGNIDELEALITSVSTAIAFSGTK